VVHRSVSALVILPRFIVKDQPPEAITASAIIQVVVYQVVSCIDQETTNESILTTSSHEGKSSLIISHDKVTLSGTAIVKVKTASSPATTVLPVVSTADVVSNCFSKDGETISTELVSNTGSETKFGHPSILEKLRSTPVFT
jgi:hypothetical protein